MYLNIKGKTENKGKKCAAECGWASGPCNFCGSGLCCQKNLKYRPGIDKPGCENTDVTDTEHMRCVTKNRIKGTQNYDISKYAIPM